MRRCLVVWLSLVLHLSLSLSLSLTLQQSFWSYISFSMNSGGRHELNAAVLPPVLLLPSVSWKMSWIDILRLSKNFQNLKNEPIELGLSLLYYNLYRDPVYVQLLCKCQGFLRVCSRLFPPTIFRRWPPTMHRTHWPKKKKWCPVIWKVLNRWEWSGEIITSSGPCQQFSTRFT